MPGVISERYRRAIGIPNAAVGAEDQKLFAAKFAGVPAHAGVLRESKNVATRTIEQHLFGQRQTACRSTCFGSDLVDVRRGVVRNLALVHQLIEPPRPSGTKQELADALAGFDGRLNFQRARLSVRHTQTWNGAESRRPSRGLTQST